MGTTQAHWSDIKLKVEIPNYLIEDMYRKLGESFGVPAGLIMLVCPPDRIARLAFIAVIQTSTDVLKKQISKNEREKLK